MRLNQLTFTRFIAAIFIVIFHYGQKVAPFNNEFISFIFKGADVGVSYFFILSGFVMIIAYSNYSKISIIDYFRNRVARIYPLFIIAILLVLIQQIIKREVDFIGLFLNVFMIQAWIPGKILSLNSPGWSLSVEFIFYLLFPFFFNNVFKKFSLKKIAFYCILFWILTQIIYNVSIHVNWGETTSFTKEILRYNPLMHLNQFLIGNLAGLVFVKQLKLKTANYDVPILLIFGLVIIALKFNLGLDYHNGLLAALFIPLILFISLNNGILTNIFQRKPFVFLGEISYGIYIFQYPVYSYISYYSVKKYFHIEDAALVFFLRLIILIVLAAFVYIYIEKPIQSKIKGRKSISS